MTKTISALRLAVLSALAFSPLLFPADRAAAADAASPGASCAPDNGGLSLPPGFCASIFADNVGHVRHMFFRDGTLYANTWSGGYYNDDTPPAGGFLLALKDTKGAGTADSVSRFGPSLAQGSHGGTGIAYWNGYVYAEMNDKVVRYRLPAGGAAPDDKYEVVVDHIPLGGDHPMHPFVIDAEGHLYLAKGSATNACEVQNRTPYSPGNNPCTETQTRAGIWLFDAAKLNQEFSPASRYATGLRNGEGLAFDQAGRLFATQHGRDQLSEDWPKYYGTRQGVELPAEEMVQVTKGADFGWPTCYFDGFQKKLVLAPEYGGDGGKKVGICAQKQAPVAFFPAHWAPNDLLIASDKLPAPYRGGAFLAFHGSWNRAPAPQDGYRVVFQPFKDGKVQGAWVTFADGFAGAYKEPGRAAFRPSGLAEDASGALYVADDMHGRIWRIVPKPGATIAKVEAAPAVKASAAAEVAGGDVSKLPVPPGATAAQVALGNRIFHGDKGGTCAGCHGSDGRGSPVAANLTDATWLWSKGDLAGIKNTIIQGVPHPKQANSSMPPRGGTSLSDQDIDALAAYVWALSHASSH